MQIWAESGKSALPICNYSQILYQFLTFTQNLKRSLLVAKAVRKGRTQGLLTRPAASDNRCRCAFVCIAAHLSRFPAFCAGLP